MLPRTPSGGTDMAKAVNEDTSSSARALSRMPFGSPISDVLAVVARDGGVILTGALSREQVDAVNTELDAVMGATDGSFGTAEDNYLAKFMGSRTKRLQHCIKHSRTYREAYLANEVLAGYVAAMLDGGLGNQMLFATHAIEIHPGEIAQELHRDGRGFLKRLGLECPGAVEVVMNTLLALTDITEDMGATRVIPGSHLWEDYTDFGSQEQTVPALMSAGDILLINGRVLHSGGANVTANRARRLIATSWCMNFLMSEEAWPFALSVEEVRTWPPVLQSWVGFRSVSYRGESPGFLWRVDNKPLEEVLGMGGADNQAAAAPQ
jgi:ectoine hydroxylase-related dioxygenase (phytanoyl-CoA dioxygenase family)